MTFLVIGGVLFIAAGRLDWSEAWAFLIAYFVIALVTAVWLLRTSPELTQERARPGRNAKAWDNLLMVLNLVLTLALFAVIGLDAGRCGWSKVPLALRGLGLLGFIPAFGLPLWAAAVNAYLSSRVRIQTERGHTVVAAGPYRYVRHPMYAGMICYDLSVPLLLGSWWGLAVGAVMIAVPEYAAPGKSVKRRVASWQRTASPAVAACRLYASCGFILGGFDACLYRGVMPGCTKSPCSGTCCARVQHGHRLYCGGCTKLPCSGTCCARVQHGHRLYCGECTKSPCSVTCCSQRA